jgi:hypothetical protein
LHTEALLKPGKNYNSARHGLGAVGGVWRKCMENNEEKDYKTPEEKGKRAEELFVNYLNDKKIPFFRTDQEIDTKSEVLKEKDAVRYDYLISTKNGIFYTDVKYREKRSFGKNKETRFRIGHDMIKLLSNLKNELRQEIWLAFTDNFNIPEFYFTTLTCINNYYEHIRNKYNEKYNNFSDSKYIYIPNELIIFNQLSYEIGFYKELDSCYIEEEAEYLNQHELDYQKSNQ